MMTYPTVYHAPAPDGPAPSLPLTLAALDGRLARLRERLHGPALAPHRARRDETTLDAMAAESAALDALTLGLIPPDVAEYIARTRDGHPA